MEGWRTHFHKLAMKTHNENYDLEFLDNVKEEVKVILELCKSNFFHQSIRERPFYLKGGLWFFSKKNILIPNFAEKNILILVDEKKK